MCAAPPWGPQPAQAAAEPAAAAAARASPAGPVSADHDVTTYHNILYVLVTAANTWAKHSTVTYMQTGKCVCVCVCVCVSSVG